MRARRASLISTVLLLMAALLSASGTGALACTQVAMAGPLGPGLTYIDGSTPVIFKHQNAPGNTVIRYKTSGTSAGGTEYEPYVYKHSFIYMGRDEAPPTCFSVGMNDSGTSHATQNWGGTGGPDNWNTRERAMSMGTGFEGYEEIIRAESIANTVVLAGPRGGDITSGYITAGYILQGETTIMGPNEPLFLHGEYEDEFMDEVNNMDNWSRGDPSRLEIRDMAHIWHLHNENSEYGMMAVPQHRVIWLTGGPPAKGPFIPFCIDDPYIHQDFQDLTYYQSLDSEPYTLDEIAEIEDAIMAPDGSIIGDIRQIQHAIARRLPMPPPDDPAPPPPTGLVDPPKNQSPGSAGESPEQPGPMKSLLGGCAIGSEKKESLPWWLCLAALFLNWWRQRGERR